MRIQERLDLSDLVVAPHERGQAIRQIVRRRARSLSAARTAASPVGSSFEFPLFCRGQAKCVRQKGDRFAIGSAARSALERADRGRAHPRSFRKRFLRYAGGDPMSS